MDLDVAGVGQAVSTGAVPAGQHIDELLARAFDHAALHREGAVADYIPVLAKADPEAFGLCVADVEGGLHELGDTGAAFSIQSISKVFVYALLCDEFGHERASSTWSASTTPASRSTRSSPSS